jgi:hypothetical protein
MTKLPRKAVSATSKRSRVRHTRQLKKAVDAVLLAQALQVPGIIANGGRFIAGPKEIGEARIVARAALSTVRHRAVR